MLKHGPILSCAIPCEMNGVYCNHLMIRNGYGLKRACMGSNRLWVVIPSESPSDTKDLYCC